MSSAEEKVIKRSVIKAFCDDFLIRLARVNASYAAFWRNKLSWTITVLVFLTILAVQSIVGYMSYQSYKDTRYNQIITTTKSVITSLASKNNTLDRFLSVADIDTVLIRTKAQGLITYDINFNEIARGGRNPKIILRQNEPVSGPIYDKNTNVYDVVYTPNQLNYPYYVSASLDLNSLDRHLSRYALDSAIIILLLSAFLTTVLMSALGYWFLQPTIVLTDILAKALKDPENPDILTDKYPSLGGKNDAIGSAITLIKQNADHIKRVKENAEDKIHRLAYYDALTELPNRTLFVDKLRDFSNAADDGEHFVVIALDLDHFKDVNDSMGHDVGDTILQSVGERLKKSLPERAVVARSGEDSFAVMLPIIEGVNTPRDIANRVALSIKGEHFQVMDEEFRIHCSVGYAVYPQDGDDPDKVLKKADIALNRAKEEGRDIIRAYSRDFDVAVQSRFQLLRDLRFALENDEFELHFQPQFDLKSEKIIGAEALIRWWKPDDSKAGGKYISPGEFIPIAESSGLIVPIGDWVLREGCMTAVGLKNQGIDDMRIAINVSGAQFRQKDLVENVEHVLHETGLEPKLLEIEVTESAFMEDMNKTVETLRKLHELGVELAIDDFGTGYSSLAYLRQFPIDRLKIDRSFIINALNNADDASITRTIIGLGRSLNLKVLAEGVETTDHQKYLIDEGCDEVQGFKYSKPLPLKEFIEFCKKYNGTLSAFDK